MNLTSLDLNLLVVFEAVLEARSVTRAAARLGIRQPAISASLARLREIFSDELFTRAAGEMMPTPKALSIAPGVKAALAQLRDTLGESLPFDPCRTSKIFTIASTDYTSMVLLPALMKDIADKAPSVDLRVIGYDKDDIRDMIDRGEIDLALGVFRPPPERAVQKLLWQEHFVGLARQKHPAIRNGGMTLESYIAQSHALVSMRRDATGEIDSALAATGRSRRIALTLPHMTALPSVLLQSDIVCAVPSRIASQLANAGLAQFDLPLDLPPWNVEMLWNAFARKDQSSIWLRTCVARVAQFV